MTSLRNWLLHLKHLLVRTIPDYVCINHEDTGLGTSQVHGQCT